MHAKKPTMERRGYRPAEIAAMLGTSTRWVHTQINAGKLTASRLSPQVTVVLAKDLERFLERYRVPANR